MLDSNTVFLNEYYTGIYKLPSEDLEENVICVIIRIAACIPGIGIMCGVGYIAESCRLRQLDPSLHSTANQMLLRGVVSLIGLGILNIPLDLVCEPEKNDLIDLILQHGYACVKQRHTFISEMNRLSGQPPQTLTGYCKSVSKEIFEKHQQWLDFFSPYLEQSEELFAPLSQVSLKVLLQLKDNRQVIQKLVDILLAYPNRKIDVNRALELLLAHDAIDEKLLQQLAPAAGDDLTLFFEIDPLSFEAGAPLVAHLKTYEQKCHLLEWLSEKREAKLAFAGQLLTDLTGELAEAVVDRLYLLPHWEELDAAPLNRALREKEPNEVTPLLFPSLEPLLDKKHFRFLRALTQGYFPVDAPLVKKAHTLLMQQFIERIPQEEILYTVKNLYLMVLDSKTKRENLEGELLSIVIEQMLPLLFHYALGSPDKERLLTVYKELKEGVIQGGTLDHAVLYVVREEEGGTRSFTVYNSGEAAPLKGNKVLVQSYTRLTEAELSPAFFATLESYKSEHLPFTPVQLFIDKSLKNVKTDTSHKVQNHDSCAYKCLSHYLHDTLGDKEWRRFKVWLTEALLERFKALPKGPYLPISEEAYDSMLQEAEDVLLKRIKKSL